MRDFISVQKALLDRSAQEDHAAVALRRRDQSVDGRPRIRRWWTG
jgi:hypothetical protein